MYNGNTLATALRAASLGRETHVFATDQDTGAVTSYAVLWDEAERIAGSLVEMGVQPGDRVAVQIEKSVSAIALYLGTVLCGAVHLPLNTAYMPSEVAYFLTDAAPVVFVCDPARLETLQKVAAEAGTKIVLTLDAHGTGTLTDAALASQPISMAVPRGPNDLAAFLYTSGTTGRSKGAMLTHGNLISNALSLRDLWQFTESDVLIHALPIFHTHGLFVALNVTLLAGSQVLLHRAFKPEKIIADFAHATTMMGVPTFYSRLLDQPNLTPAATAKMRLFVSGSAPMLIDTHTRWTAQTGHQVLERYGMTETNMITSNPYSGVRKPGTVGLPLPGVELRLVDGTGNTPAIGDVGGIEVRGPNLFKGYWNMPEKTAEDMRPGGWFVTGDLGQLDGGGYLSIVGRSKDLIIAGGYNIYPKEIEVLIDALDGVVESAAFGVPHADFGESVAVAVVADPQIGLTADQIMAAISPNLARFKHPRHIHFVDALPRNAMGKVQKNQLRDGFAEI